MCPEHFIKPRCTQHELPYAPHPGELIENDEIKKKRLGFSIVGYKNGSGQVVLLEAAIEWAH